MNTNMRIVAVEEHFAFADLLARIESKELRKNGWPSHGSEIFSALNPDALTNIGQQRIDAMDEAGITVQVLSVPAPGAEIMPGAEGIEVATEYNNRLRLLTSSQPDRFAAFAHLPMLCPDAAADELERAVKECGLRGALINGTIGGKFLDSPEFIPLLAMAERLKVPLYIHPGLPPDSVRGAYYDGLPGHASFALAISGWGWHAETAVHILRLALSGTLDRFPELKLLIGHMGEGLPAMMSRIERVFSRHSDAHLERNAARAIMDQVWVSTSGYSDMPSFLGALMTFGADRLMFSVDYPFGSNQTAVNFLDKLPVSSADRRKIAHGNADALLGIV